MSAQENDTGNRFGKWRARCFNWVCNHAKDYHDGDIDAKLYRRVDKALLNDATTEAEYKALYEETQRKADAKPNPRHKRVNARMLEKMAADPTCHGWKLQEWADFLKCATTSVWATPTWKKLAKARENQPAGQARDRRGRNQPRRKGDYGPE